jgi:SAM-dependent methyltransferase
VAYDRNLASINRKLLKGSEILQDSIRERLNADRSIAVLDIGCGLGAALLELAWTFRNSDVRFTGINKDAGEPLASREDFRTTARQIGLGPDNELDSFRLPELFFEDATHMHFEDESFDVVYASSVLRFVPQKAEFLENVARVLRPGGVALIRIGSKGWDYPQGPVSGSAELTPFTARWVLRHEGELIPLEAYLKLASGSDFELELINRPNCVIRVVKHRRASLALGLRYVPTLSLPMRQLGYGDEDRGLAKGGVRSVYDVPDAQYRLLVERGLIENETAHPALPPAQQGHARANFGGIVNRAWRRSLATCALFLYTASGAACGLARTVPLVRAIPHVRVVPIARTVHHLSRFDWGSILFIGALGTWFLPQGKRKRLGSYRVGQRVNIKGRRQGRRFSASKIKMVHYEAAQDHLEGPVEWVDAADRTLGLFGITALAGDLVPDGDETNPLRELHPGATVRVHGKCSDGRFVAGGIDMVPASAIVVEEIQGPIEAINPTRGILQVAGIPVVTNRETKIDRIDAR